MFYDKSRNLRNGTVRAILDRSMYGPNSPFAPALRSFSYAGQYQVGDTGEGGGGGPPTSYPAVENFTFEQTTNSNFQFNWEAFDNDRFLEIESSLDEGGSWTHFDIVNSSQSGPAVRSVTDFPGFSSEGGTFYTGDVYTLRVRYQDTENDPTVVGDWTEVSFEAINIQDNGGATLPDITDLTLLYHVEDEVEVTWTPSDTYYTYMEFTDDDGVFQLYNWYDPGDGGDDVYQHYNNNGNPDQFNYGFDYSMRMRYQNAPGNQTPTEFGEWAVVTFTADTVPTAQLGFGVVQQGTSALYDIEWRDQPNLRIEISLTVDGTPVGVIFDQPAAGGTGVYDSGEGWSVGQQLGFTARFYLTGDPNVYGPTIGQFTITVH